MTTSLEDIDENQCTMHKINGRFDDIEKDLINFGITLNTQSM